MAEYIHSRRTGSNGYRGNMRICAVVYLKKVEVEDAGRRCPVGCEGLAKVYPRFRLGELLIPESHIGVGAFGYSKPHAGQGAIDQARNGQGPPAQGIVAGMVCPESWRLR
jgi:hypothetical protein